MKWSIELLAVSIICLCHQAHMARYLNYQRKAMLDDFLPTNGSLYKCLTRSKLECSTRCESVTGIKSFFYVHNTTDCKCYGTSYATSDGLSSVPSARYYEKLGSNTCAMLKHCSPSKTDGEYWLEPEVLGTRVKIYCHNMTSQSPQEYITLSTNDDPVVDVEKDANKHSLDDIHETILNSEITGTEVRYVPGGNMVYHSGHSENISPQRERTINFQKVAVNLTDMTILSSDLTFTDYVSGDWSPYGMGGGCRDPIAGYFNINTTGTGLILDPSLVWAAEGWRPYMNTFYRSPDGTQISAICGGMCGKCESTSAMNLQINTNEELPASDAAWPTCG